MGKKVFISKNASEIESYRSQFEAKGYSIIAHSFLSFSPVSFNIQCDYDVVFFGSPRAVMFFTAVESIPEDVKIGCVGAKTAEVVKSLGYTADFVGTKSSEPRLVAEEFRRWLEGLRTSAALSPRGDKDFKRFLGAERSRSARVLFPISDRSLKTISSGIPEAQKEEVVVYSTEVKGCVVEECDVYVFSSPSNVEGFFLENEIPEVSEVVAWGRSTEGALASSDVYTDYCLTEGGFESLIQSIKN